jgi:hypothetical protein
MTFTILVCQFSWKLHRSFLRTNCYNPQEGIVLSNKEVITHLYGGYCTLGLQSVDRYSGVGK